jgi:hypothetical protein
LASSAAMLRAEKGTVMLQGMAEGRGSACQKGGGSKAAEAAGRSCRRDTPCTCGLLAPELRRAQACEQAGARQPGPRHAPLAREKQREGVPQRRQRARLKRPQQQAQQVEGPRGAHEGEARRDGAPADKQQRQPRPVAKEQHHQVGGQLRPG